jgi:hypothetical protein
MGLNDVEKFEKLFDKLLKEGRIDSNMLFNKMKELEKKSSHNAILEDNS